MPKKRKASTRSKSPVKLKSRSVSTRARSAPAARVIGRFAIPLLIILALGAAIAFMAITGYQTAIASGFFALKNIDIQGIDRTPAEDIRRIVTAEAEKPGVWNADLGEIREKVEKFPFVKAATVSRALPSGIHVKVTERVPAATVQLSSGKYLVDGEGTLLTAAKGDKDDFPFILRGWDESKTPDAMTDNIARLKLYQKMMDEWQQFDLSTRVKEVNLTNPRTPVVTVEDSGRAVGITLGRDNLGRGLKTALEALTGKGDRVKSINAAGVYPVIQYLDF